MLTNGDVLRMRIRCAEINQILDKGNLPSDVVLALQNECREYIRLLSNEEARLRREKFKVIR